MFFPRPWESRIMTKETAQKQLDRALANLDRVAGYMEDAGLATQRNLLDAAADRVEDVREPLAAL
jgi:hypothetical protein